MSDCEGDRVLVNKPKNTRFHQQRLKSWRPVLTAQGAYPVFLVIGILFVPIGAFLLVTSNQIVEKNIEYTHCKQTGSDAFCSEKVREFAGSSDPYQSCPCTVEFTLDTDIKGTVYLFYGLSNFFQNHRLYVMSKDDNQLHGREGTPSKDCEPYRFNGSGVAYAPCGAIAMSLFNDTFELKYLGTQESSTGPAKTVPMSKKGIAWKSDVEAKYGKPSSWAGTTKPDSWPQTALERSPDAYSGDEELLVWMRPAALPSFRKLHRIVEPQDIFNNGLPAGKYAVDIKYAYPVTQFGGTKRIILTNTNWLGGRNPTLGIGYIVVGVISLVFGILFLILNYRLPRRFNISRN